MKTRIIVLLITLFLLLSTSVAAHDMCYIFPEHPSDEILSVGNGGVSPLNILCTLFGHADPIARNVGTYTQTMCIKQGDSICRAVCYRYNYCSRCDENLGSAHTGHHIRDGYCLQDMWDQYHANWVYDCITCN